MVIFAALFMVIITILFGAFGQRIQDFLQENVLGTFFSLLSVIIGRFRGSTEAKEEVEPLTPSPPSPTTGGSEFQVFLSFRGEDTRKGFTGHLYDDLKQRGVSTFKDDKKLEKGEEIVKLFEYIKKSKIFVPIFSKRYAESKWCLKEVVEGLECGKDIVPVFFGVEPSDVRNQSGPFKSAFKKHESNKQQDQEELRKWREALRKVASLSGFSLKELNWDEAKLRRAVIKKVLDKVNKKPLQVAKHPIGIETRVQDVKKMLENGGNVNGVHMVGIHGMGGLGKTTIAKAVYNKLSQEFNGATCFLSDVRENARQPNGLVTLQKRVFHELLKDGDTYLTDVAHGVSLIKERAKEKRVLLILDDVGSIDQLNALAGARDWFGSGSVIIITTRDEGVLLAQKMKQHEIYKPKVLNEEESRKLFLQHAFNGKEPEGDYLRLSNEVVAAAGGLPLTIEVLGSLLTCDIDAEQWQYTLDRLKKIPHTHVQQRLKLSYDRLDKIEQKIFLDISCFFIGRHREYATFMWEGSDWFPTYAIKVLEQRSLIKINEKRGEFEMHDQIRDMGRAIVNDETSGMPWKQSRLWISEDRLNLLQRKVPGTIDVEGIQIYAENDCVSAECFENMPNLRYLDVVQLNFQGTSQSFPRQLRWLRLQDCHFDSPPSDFNLRELVILDLSQSNTAHILINQLWLTLKVFKKLKVLSVDGADIKVASNFTNFPSLVKLNLVSFAALTTIDESIGELKNLKYLHIRDCEILGKLPDSIGRLSKLEVLDISGCSIIAFLKEQLGDMQSLKELHLNTTSIVNVPDSIGRLSNLRKLHMLDCRRLSRLPNSICQLSLVEILDVRGCIGLTSLPQQLGDMRSLRYLGLGRTSIVNLPDSIGQLTNLRQLDMKLCKRLSRLPDSICRLSSLEKLDLEGCAKLSSLPERLGDIESLKKLDLSQTCIEVIPDSIGQLTNLDQLCMKYSENLVELPDTICQLSLLESLNLNGCCNLCSLPERLGFMEKLRELILDNTRIDVIPDSVGQLKNLRRLSLEGCKFLKALPDSVRRLSSLQQLNTSGTILNSFEILAHRPALDIGYLKCSSFELLGLNDQSRKALKHLHLNDVVIEKLPDCVEGMENIEKLQLECEMLKVLPNRIDQYFPQKLAKLEIASKHLKALPDCIGSLKQLWDLTLKCENLQRLPDSIGGLENVVFLVIESAKLKALPSSIALLGQLSYLELHCMRLEAIPDSIGGLKGLEDFELQSNSLNALPASIGLLKQLWRFTLRCPSLEKLPDSIGELERLSYFEVDSHGLICLPNSIGSLTGTISLVLNCPNLEALPDSMETLQRLYLLELHCDNFTVPPDFIGRLQNLERFSFKSKNLNHLPATIHESLGRLEELSLGGCENLKDLAAASIQQTGLTHLLSLRYLHLKDCKRLEHLPQLPSSLWSLDASGCTSLLKMPDISGLQNMQNLNLGGCKLLEGVPGLESISNNLEVLKLPGPCDHFVGCCQLSHDFKNKVFKEMSFDSLMELGMSGSIVQGSVSGQKQLSFMLPRLPFNWLRRARLMLGLDQALSPVHIAIRADGILVFQKIVEFVEGADELDLNLREENIENTGEGEGEHCYTMQVTTDVSRLQNVWAVLQHPTFENRWQQIFL